MVQFIMEELILENKKYIRFFIKNYFPAGYVLFDIV